jgi:4-aminobutyrate aminotransferase-like enzyme
MKIRFYPFVPAQAEGVRITDSDGNSYLDFVAGVARCRPGTGIRP